MKIDIFRVRAKAGRPLSKTLDSGEANEEALADEPSAMEKEKELVDRQ